MIEMPPQNLAAEQSVLGCALLNEDGADTAVALCREDQFHSTDHQELFSIIRKQRAAGLRPDVVTVTEECAKRIAKSEHDTAIWLWEILETVPHSNNVGHYSAIVRDRWMSRAAIYAFNEAKREVSDPTVNPIEAVVKTIEKLQDLIADGDPNGPVRASDVLIESISRGDEHRLPTGFYGLDSLTGGLSKKSLIILGARPSVGKTALAVAVAKNIAELGAPVAFFSLEMSRKEILQRLSSAYLQAPYTVVRDGRLTVEELQRAEAFAASPCMNHLLIDDQIRSVEDISAVTRLHVRRFGIKAVFIDYLQLIPPSNAKIPRHEQVAACSRSLKALAKSADIPVICLAQLNRESEKRDQKKPRLADLRESGAIEQDADQVLLLWRPNKDSETGDSDDRGELIVAKSRNGKTGSIELGWDGATMTYHNHIAGDCEVPDGF